MESKTVGRKMSSIIKKIFIIIIGIPLAFIFSGTIEEITAIYLGNYSSNSTLLYLIIFGLFGIWFIMWIMAKKLILRGLLVLIIVAAYLLGRVYALNVYETVKDAQTLYSEAYFTSGFSALTDTTVTTKLLDTERKYVALVKEASEKPKEAGAKQFYVSLYNLAQESLDYDEKISTGLFRPTEEETNKFVKDILNKKQQLFKQGYTIPFWETFFFIK